MAWSSKSEATRLYGTNVDNVENSDEGSFSTETAVSEQGSRQKLEDKLQFHKKKRQYISNNNITIKRSNKLLHALYLPTIINLNPSSIYNKVDEFHTLVEEEEADIIFMSESWERENKTLNEIINLPDHVVISNVNQRRGVGGRPALIINSKKFVIQNLTQSVIKVPWGVEIVWALITPKYVQSDSKIQKIVLAAIYSKPNSKKKTATLDHISDVFNEMSVKYQKGLHFIISGDTNELKLDSILQLSSQMKQVVSDFTRMNPPRILDPIITTLSQYYQKPLVLPPLDPDPDKDGKPSDHKIVKMKPINTIDNISARNIGQVTFRPTPKSGLDKLMKWEEEQK